MACYRMESTKYNLRQQYPMYSGLPDIALPLMKKLQADGQAVRRLDSATVNAGASVTVLLVWSSRLAECQAKNPETSQEQVTTSIPEYSNQSKFIDYQRRVVDHLMEHIKRQDERMDSLEAKMDGTSSRDKYTLVRTITRTRQTEMPTRSTSSKQQKSDTTLLVAFTKLFLDGGFELDTTTLDYRDRDLNLGKRLEVAMLSFLVERKINSCGSGNIRKLLRIFHRSDILKAKIGRYQRLIQTASIKDLASGYMQDVLEVATRQRFACKAIGAFKIFLKPDEVTEEYIRKCIEYDERGSGTEGKLLTRNTVMHYYRQAKLWTLDQFPLHRSSLESRLLKMEKTLDSFCLKRGVAMHVVRLTTKIPLRCIYIDTFVVIRMKTSEEQGLSLFPDTDVHSRPLLAVALELIFQAALCEAVIGNLPVSAHQATATLASDVPLVELLSASATITTPASLTAKGTDTSSTIRSHVNRMLDLVAPAAGVKRSLTSYPSAAEGLSTLVGVTN
ncbi:Hypothetical protein PHPALM_17344 [Phytophthora palmivora]|uniref:Uncharacterized protein n=1 Tax=Phytophthora palmivora TaxID=4796 RepID=A0A2P4XMK9_9STRA|nr:Hypothetical protein PHPALM_17344 [Phytophthora palmivora]